MLRKNYRFNHFEHMLIRQLLVICMLSSYFVKAQNIDLSSSNGVNNILFTSPNIGDEFGETFGSSIIGDINNDGFDDMIFTAPGHNSNNGIAYVVFGAASAITTDLSSLNGSNGFTVTTDLIGTKLGAGASGAGDFNGDGITDFMVGAPEVVNSDGFIVGTTYLIYGSANSFPATINVSSLNGSNGFKIGAPETDTFYPNDFRSGTTLANAGDMNDDGFDDIAIGAPGGGGRNFPNRGTIYVLYGSNTISTDSITLDSNPSSSMGVNVRIVAQSITNLGSVQPRAVGDLNGDDFDDLIVGSPVFGNFSADAAYVIYGGTSPSGGIVDLQNINGFTTSTNTLGYAFEAGFTSGIGTTVDGIGDFNGDGLNDIIMTTGSFQGDVFVVFGSSTTFPAITDVTNISASEGFKILGINSTDRLRQARGIGDFNGDGLSDILLGASTVSTVDDTNKGEAYILFGSTDSFGTQFDLSTINGTNGIVISGVNADEFLGLVLGTGGDINGDGYDDVVLPRKKDGLANSINIVTGDRSQGSGLVWNGNSNTSWDEATNWGPYWLSKLPTSSDLLIIPDQTSTTNSLIVSSTLTVDSLVIESNGLLIVNENLEVSSGIFLDGTINVNRFLISPSEMIISENGTLNLLGGTYAGGSSSSITNHGIINLSENRALTSAMQMKNEPTGTINASSGSAFSVISGNSLENNGNIIINSGASLVVNGTLSGTGTETFRRNVNSNGALSIIGSPVSGTTGSDLNATFKFKFNDATQEYEELLNADAIIPGMGVFAGSSTASYAIELTGRLHTGNLTVPISINDFSLVANPYGSAISTSGFLANTTNSTNTTGVVYIWDDGGQNVSVGGGEGEGGGRGGEGGSSSDNRGGDYITINAIGSVGGSDLGDGISGTNGAGAYNGNILAQQGFFVEGDGSSVFGNDIEFTPSMQSSGGNADANFFRTEEINKIKISLSGNNLTNELIIAFHNEGTLQKDKGLDAIKLSGNELISFYSLQNDMKYAIQALPKVESSMSVRLGFDLVEEGEYQINILEMEAMDYLNISLRDVNTGHYYSIDENSQIIFKSSSTSFDTRFELVFENNQVLATDSDFADFQVFGSKNNLSIIHPELNGNENVTIHSIDWKLIHHSQVEFKNGSGLLDLTLSPEIIYILSIRDQQLKFRINK